MVLVFFFRNFWIMLRRAVRRSLLFCRMGRGKPPGRNIRGVYLVGSGDSLGHYSLCWQFYGYAFIIRSCQSGFKTLLRLYLPLNKE